MDSTQSFWSKFDWDIGKTKNLENPPNSVIVSTHLEKPVCQRQQHLPKLSFFGIKQKNEWNSKNPSCQKNNKKNHWFRFTSWWFQPSWKICSSNWESSSNRGENKNYWNHHPVIQHPVYGFVAKSICPKKQKIKSLISFQEFSSLAANPSLRIFCPSKVIKSHP